MIKISEHAIRAIQLVVRDVKEAQIRDGGHGAQLPDAGYERSVCDPAAKRGNDLIDRSVESLACLFFGLMTSDMRAGCRTRRGKERMGKRDSVKPFPSLKFSFQLSSQST